MTQQEFDKTEFVVGMTAVYDDYKYRVASVNFKEYLIGLGDINECVEDDDLTWVRCESVELIK